MEVPSNIEVDSDKATEAKKKRAVGYNTNELISQFKNEHMLAYNYIFPKLEEWYIRLKLYSNQRRDKSAVGDPLMFTVHQTITASLYSDQLAVQFAGREDDGGDDERADMLQDAAEFDYEEMEKDKADYEWIWDTGFFGRGLQMFTGFDRDSMTPIIEVIDPTTFLRDPRAQSANGSKYGRNGLRFWGRYIRRTKQEMEEVGGFNLEDLPKNSIVDRDSLIEKASRARSDAQNTNAAIQSFTPNLGENTEYELIQWFTNYRGKKICIEVTSDKAKIIRFLILKNQKRWPLIDRPLYPIAHDWDGVSIPDLTEDKQRARAKLINLGLETATAELYPMYVYDRNKIRNKGDLNFEFNKMIGVDGNVNGAVQPVNKATVSQAVSYILDTLDLAAQKATATPEIQQGIVGQEKRTLGELNIVVGKVDTRYSLTAKIFGWSEKAFWAMWYQMYKDFMTVADTKFIRIKGFDGKKLPKNVSKAEFIYENADPDITVESRVVSEAKRMRMLQSFQNFAVLVMADPDGNKRYTLRFLAKLVGLTPDQIERIYPPTANEILAEEENERLSKNEKVAPTAYEDPIVHLEIHDKAMDTPAKQAHLEATRELIRLRVMNPKLFPKPESAGVVGKPEARMTAPNGAGQPNNMVGVA